MAAQADYLTSLGEFEVALQSCEEILGEGRFLVAPLDGCEKYPTIYTIESTAAVTANDTSVSLQLTSPTPGTLMVRQGDVLSFELAATPGTYVEVTLAADATITDTAAVVVATEAVPAAIAANDVACAFQRFEFIGLKNMPLDFQIGTEDVKVLSDGIQGKTTKTNVQPQMGVEFLLRLDDKGFWGDSDNDVVFQSALNNVRFYGLSLRLNGEQFITGPVETTALSFQDQASQIQKATGTLVFQPTWYTGTIFQNMSTEQQDAYNAIRRLWSLPEKV